MVGDSDDDGQQTNRAVRLLRMARLLKLLRLARVKRLLDRWEEQLYSTGGFKIFKLLATLFMSAHWVSCAWYAVQWFYLPVMIIIEVLVYVGMDAAQTKWT